MEMTTRRWIAIVAIVCAAIAAFKLPPREPLRRFFAPKVQTGSWAVASTLHDRIGQLDELVDLLSRRDLLLQRAAQGGRASGPTTVVTVAPSPEVDHITKAIADHRSALGRGAERIIVGVVRDSATRPGRRLNYNTQRQFILPAAADGNHCIMVVRLGRARVDMQGAEHQGILGPCAFHVAFGPPGPAIEAWLRSRGYDVALNAALTTRADPDPSLLRVRRPTRQEDLMRYLDFQRTWRHYDVSACASGSVNACTAALRKPTERMNVPFPDGIYRESRAWEYNSALGPAVGFLLSDLMASQGRARFEKFWKSTAAFDTAFQQAFDEPAGKWTMRWMRYRYGRDTRGPYVAPRSAIVTVALSVGFVALTAAMATKREIDT